MNFKSNHNKTIPFILLLTHLLGVGIQAFHHHTHFTGNKSNNVYFLLSDIDSHNDDNEQNCSICYFASQHVSCEPSLYKPQILNFEIFYQTENYCSQEPAAPVSIPTRAPPQS
jgi:hypothetical protein